MLDLILKRKTFFIACAGVVLTIFIIIGTRKPLPTSTPLLPVSQSPFAKSIAASGIIESVDENFQLSSAVGGLVKSIPVKVNQKVNSGDLLLSLDDRAIFGEFLVSRAQLQKIAARYQKVAALKNTDAISRDEYDSILHDYQIAEANVKRSELLLDQLKIRAPTNGIVLQISVRVGEMVGPNSPKAPILFGKDEGIQIRADVDEVNASLIPEKPVAKAVIKGSKQNFDLEFLRIEPYVLPKKSLTGDNTERVDTRVLQIIFKAPMQAGLYIGQQVDVYVERL